MLKLITKRAENECLIILYLQAFSSELPACQQLSEGNHTHTSEQDKVTHTHTHTHTHAHDRAIHTHTFLPRSGIPYKAASDTT